MAARWFTSFRVFLVWLLGSALALVILALLHELFMVFIVNTLQLGSYVVRFLNILYYFPVGVACIAYFIFVYSYLERSARKGILLKNSMRVIGVQLLIISLAQLGLIGYRFLPATGINTIIVLVEALAAAVLIVLGWRGQKQPSGLAEENKMKSGSTTEGRRP